MHRQCFGWQLLYKEGLDGCEVDGEKAIEWCKARNKEKKRWKAITNGHPAIAMGMVG